MGWDSGFFGSLTAGGKGGGGLLGRLAEGILRGRLNPGGWRIEPKV